jgi:hypothetical protein
VTGDLLKARVSCCGDVIDFLTVLLLGIGASARCGVPPFVINLVFASKSRPSFFLTMQRPFPYDLPVPSPISILPFNTSHPIYSLRATADASTPSTASIDTPIQDRFVVQPSPITANESCHSHTYSGQAVHPCQCMPLDPLDCFPLASSSSKPYPNGEGAIRGYQAPPSALLNPHRVMCKCQGSLSLGT